MTTETTTPETTATSTPTAATAESVQRAFSGIVEIGRVWANYGLGLAGAAIEASTKSLELAGSAISAVQSKVNDAATAVQGAGSAESAEAPKAASN